ATMNSDGLRMEPAIGEDFETPTVAVAVGSSLGSIAPRELGEARITCGTFAQLDREAGRGELVAASGPTHEVAEKEGARLIARARDLQPLIKDHSSFHSIRRPIRRHLRRGRKILLDPSVTVESRR